MLKDKLYKLHFVGIGGVGMSGIAEIFHNLGHIVTGSDIAINYTTERLVNLGIKVYTGHNEDNVDHADVIVISSAINKSNPEYIAAIKRKIPIIPRAVMLAELMRMKQGIAIAGTHGKTTTTSLCAETLSGCNLDPTFVIGGKLATTGSNAKLGLGDYLVAEADESDASFLYLTPVIAVVTNIDYDHMETYDHSLEKLKQAFINFLQRLPFYGRAILCNEDKNIRDIIPHIDRSVILYGLTDDCDIYATNIKVDGATMRYTVNIPARNIVYDIKLNLIGIHNVLNSLAVIATSLECDCNIHDIAQGLAGFHGVGRRAQRYNDIKVDGGVAFLIDDYAHHPTEMNTTISAFKLAYPNHRLVLVFQPHRYTRTRDLFKEFVLALIHADVLILHDIYSAGEPPIKGISSEDLLKSVQDAVDIDAYVVKDLTEACLKIKDIINADDLVVTMGAGSIGKLPNMLLDYMNDNKSCLVGAN